MISPARSLVGLRLGDRSVDVAVPHGTPVYDVLRATGADLDDPTLTVVDSSGQQVDIYSTTGEHLSDGAVLHVLTRPTAVRVAKGGRRDVHDPTVTRPTTSPWWLGVAGAAAVVVTATVVLGIGRGVAPATDRWILAATLLVAALALAVTPRRPGTAGSLWPTVVAALTGAAAGAATVDTGLAAAAQLLVVAALTGATVATAARWGATRRARDEAADHALILLVVLAGAALVCAGVVLMGLPPVLAAAVLLGAVPLVLRALPSMSVDVPDEQLVDVARVASSAVGVRTPEPEPLGAVNHRMVQRTVHSAERRRDVGTVVVSLVPPLTAPLVLASAEQGGLTGWASLVAVLLVALSLGLQPRTTRGAVVRWAPRVSAGVLLVELGLLGAAVGGPVALVATGTAVGVGLGVAALSLSFGRGWRSVGFSRLADGLEGLSTTLALPVSLVGAGAVEVLRLITSA
ncbi:hypothetical protein [Actinotalea sp. JY-7876]|uniref:hypothetical protein n=3 Tax=unclassified Actinotalea TaxID=2638618 RepID=UPI0015F711EC|nr:hypothetical protein [Actinotalea sp. JY-7876]